MPWRRQPRIPTWSLMYAWVQYPSSGPVPAPETVLKPQCQCDSNRQKCTREMFMWHEPWFMASVTRDMGADAGKA
eukprot:3496244-Amphidinium_carterae.1